MTITAPAFENLIQTTIWIANPERPGYIISNGRLTWDQAWEAFKASVDPLVDEYLTPEFDQAIKSEVIPKFRWVSAWAVEGSNEGHYVHIELRNDEGKIIPFGIIKTFLGEDYAWELCKFIQRLLQP